MVVTLLAAWLVASKLRTRRSWGFGLFIVSNALWIVWAWHTSSYALIVLQIGLFVTNVRGVRTNPADEMPLSHAPTSLAPAHGAVDSSVAAQPSSTAEPAA